MENTLHESVQGRVSTSPNDTLMTTVVSNGNDALNLLFEAAQREENNNRSPHAPAADGSSFDTIVAPIPCILDTNQNSLPELSSEVLETWNAYRFVRMGWLSASETVWLLDMSVRPCFGRSKMKANRSHRFFKDIAPLTPILDQCEYLITSYLNARVS